MQSLWKDVKTLFILGSLKNLFITSYPVLIGVWVLFDKKLYDSTQNLINDFDISQITNFGSWDVSVILFWLSIILWAAINANETKQQTVLDTNRYVEITNQFADVISTIHKMPNPELISQYDDIYNDLFYQLKKFEALRKQRAETSTEALEDSIYVILENIVKLTRLFSGNNDCTYTANIMLLFNVKPKEEMEEKLLEVVKYVSQFLIFNGDTNIYKLGSILYLVPELKFIENLDRTDMLNSDRIPNIALPVPKTYEVDSARQALPGAPTAALKGNSIQKDNSALSDECKDFSKLVSDKVNAYFSSKGGGKHIKSLASFRIGNKSRPVGVVNIDSDKINILGDRDEFYETFFAFLTPMLKLLDPLVEEYAHRRIVAGTLKKSESTKQT